MVGNAADAAFIAAFVPERTRIMEERNGYDYGIFCGPVQPLPEIPEGWRWIGSGQYRTVWLSPEGVIYKVQHRHGFANGRENENSRRIRAMHDEKWLIAYAPQTTYFEDSKVVAMEYVQGERVGYCTPWDHSPNGAGCQASFRGRCTHTIFAEIEANFGLRDIHDENIIFVPSQNKFAVIDMGE